MRLTIILLILGLVGCNETPPASKSPDKTAASPVVLKQSMGNTDTDYHVTENECIELSPVPGSENKLSVRPVDCGSGLSTRLGEGPWIAEKYDEYAMQIEIRNEDDELVMHDAVLRVEARSEVGMPSSVVFDLGRHVDEESTCDDPDTGHGKWGFHGH